MLWQKPEVHDVKLGQSFIREAYQHSSCVAVKLLKVLISAVLSDTTAEPSDTLPQIVTIPPVVSDDTTRSKWRYYPHWVTYVFWNSYAI